ncbi:MAG TPA: hypothetical protein VEY88_15765 [Archangium sp.]|nr:hypothetical protein [Archangium sp.]
MFTRLHDKMTWADIERLGQTTTLGGYEGEISSQFSSEGHLEWVGVGIWRRKARCAEALQAVRRALESDFGAAHPPGFHMGSNVESLKGCYEWNPAGTTILACCRQHSAPDGGFEFMSLVVSQSFGPEKLIDLDEGIP